MPHPLLNAVHMMPHVASHFCSKKAIFLTNVWSKAIHNAEKPWMHPSTQASAVFMRPLSHWLAENECHHFSMRGHEHCTTFQVQLHARVWP